MSDLRRFLSGVKVLDLSQYMPGPMATLFLADMGAEVLKIEPPTGDGMQTLGPRDQMGRPVFYRTMNAGKTVRRLNLKDTAGRAALLALVATADVLVEGFRPGVMRRLRLDYATLSAVNPRLVMCSISGYGSNASAGRKAGHDANYIAVAGMLDRNGIGDDSMFFDPPFSDATGSLFAATTILGALHWRTITGRGCEIDLALADAVMPLQMMQIADYGANGTVPTRGATYLNGGAGYYHVYRTSDGRSVVLGAIEPKFWRAFCLAAERPNWVARHDDPFPQVELRTELQDYFADLTVREIGLRFGDVDCCLSVVADLREAVTGAQAEQRQIVRRSDSGELQSLFPAWINGRPPESRREMDESGAADLPINAADLPAVNS